MSLCGVPSPSGTGSSWGVGTQLLCKTITEALMEVAAERGAAGQSDFELNLLDAPSGDFFWMPGCLEHISSKLPEGAKLNYQGVDVSTVAKDTAEGKRASVQASLPKVKIEPFLAMDLSETNILERTFPGKKLLGSERLSTARCSDAAGCCPFKLLVVQAVTGVGLKLAAERPRFDVINCHDALQHNPLSQAFEGEGSRV